MLAGGAIAGSNLSVAKGAHAFGSDRIEIGLVGCGSRGIAVTRQALATPGGDVRLVAMADVFKSNLHTAYRTLKGKHPSQVAPDLHRYVGLRGFSELLQDDLDLVILATPPGFRPQHFEAAVDAGKHVFMEKPVATDAPGVHRVLAASHRAQENGLAVQVGLQRRHEPRYRQCIDRIRSGAIGDPIFARAVWNGGVMRVHPREPQQTELEYQLRNWYYFNWLSGDHLVEQHVHNLDVINWLMDGHPTECQGQGGREVRKGPEHGQIFDHHAVEYSYPDGFKLLSQCRQIQGCTRMIGEQVYGTAGSCDFGLGTILDRQGRVRWRCDSKPVRDDQGRQQFQDLFAALRCGERPHEAAYAAESTMTAIMGRIATYSGKLVNWDDAFHRGPQLADTDALGSLDDTPPVLPNRTGDYDIPVPGQS